MKIGLDVSKSMQKVGPHAMQIKVWSLGGLGNDLSMETFLAAVLAAFDQPRIDQNLSQIGHSGSWSAVSAVYG